MFSAFLGVIYYYRWFGKIRTYANHVFCDPLKHKQSFCGRIGTCSAMSFQPNFAQLLGLLNAPIVSPAMFALFTS
jgi:hypothetical protein